MTSTATNCHSEDPVQIPTAKICSECKRSLPLSEFSKRAGTPDGLQDRCKSCFSRYNRERYARNKEKIRTDIYRYRRENPDAVLASRLRACRKSPTHRNAYRAVEAAIDAGALRRPDRCQGCGCDGSLHRIEAHHSDYSRPLDVIWLCTPCHRRMDDCRRAFEAQSRQEAKAVGRDSAKQAS